MEKKHSSAPYLFALPIFIMLINCVLVSCKKDTTTTVGSDVDMLITNLSPDAYPIRLYVGGIVQNPLTSTTIIGQQTYASYSYNTPSAYFSLKASDYPPQLRSTKPGDSVLVTVKSGTQFLSNHKYSLFLTGLQGDASLNYILTDDDTASLPAVGRGKIRYVNGSLRATSAYDVYANGTLAFSSIAYPNVSKYIELPAGRYEFKFVYKSASVTNSSNLLIDVSGITIADGHLYTLYSSGITGRTDSAALTAAIITNK